MQVGADILASAISVASKRAGTSQYDFMAFPLTADKQLIREPTVTEDTGQPLRLQCIDLKRNEALPHGHLEPWNDPTKYLVVRH